MSLDEDLEEATGTPATGTSVHPGLRRARAWLSRAVEPGTIDFWRYVDDVGPVEAVRRDPLRTGAGLDQIAGRGAGRAGRDPGRPGTGRTLRRPAARPRGRRVAGAAAACPDP